MHVNINQKGKIVLLHPIRDVTVVNLQYVMVCLVNMYRQCLRIVTARLFVCRVPSTVSESTVYLHYCIRYSRALIHWW